MATPDTSRLEADALASLEERILRAVQLVTELKQQAAAATAEADDLRTENERLQQELQTLQAERKQVRGRIEKLLGHMDSLST